MFLPPVEDEEELSSTEKELLEEWLLKFGPGLKDEERTDGELMWNPESGAISSVPLYFPSRPFHLDVNRIVSSSSTFYSFRRTLF